MVQERKVPVQQMDDSLIEQEFDSIREKFEDEMRKMEEEMSRFRLQLIASERNRLTSPSASVNQQQQPTQEQQTQINEELLRSSELAEQAQSGERRTTATKVSSSTSTKVTTSSTKSVRSSGASTLLPTGMVGGAEAGKLACTSWLSELNSPLVHEDSSGAKMLKLRFDVTAYEPEQIVVKTVGNRLQVHARREEKSENASMYREYNREFLLPEGTNPELIRSSLSADGVLTVEAPLAVSD